MKHAMELNEYIRPSDHIWISQACAEPLVLTAALVAQRKHMGACHVFTGMLLSDTFAPEACAPLRLASYGGVGRNHRLVASGNMDILPSNYSQIPTLISTGTLPCDVVMLQLSPPGPDGQQSLGISQDYMVAAARRARVVLAEVNDQMPWTYGLSGIEGLKIHARFETSHPLVEMPAGRIGETERRIAAHVASFVPDRATIEVGIGALAEAVVEAVGDRRDLGIHAGLIGDGVVRLMKKGVVTNAFKSVYPGRTTAGLLYGSTSAMQFAHGNHDFLFLPPDVTHGIGTLSKIDNFIAINSAIEVDLTGQVNAEVLGGRYVGALGGQADFVRGANQSKGGRSIIALPSTAGGGSTSRIVANLSQGVVSSARCDADVIVTEWGAAELRGQTLAERIRRMVTIAHPAHREQLEADAKKAALLVP